MRFNNVIFNVDVRTNLLDDLSSFFAVEKSLLYTTFNGAIIHELCDFPNGAVLTLHIRVYGGAPPTPQPHFRPLLLFLDSDGTPSSWLRIFESRTASSPKTRADLLLDCIPNELIAELASKIADALDSDAPYESLKAIIVQKYTSSQLSAFQKLGNPQPYSGEKPSVFLANIVRTLETAHPGLSKNLPLLAHQFLSALPFNLQTALVVVDSEDPYHLAKIADKMVALQPHRPREALPMPHTAAISTPVLSYPKPVHNTSSKASSHPSTHSTLVCSFHKRYQDEALKCCIGCSHPRSQTVVIIPVCIYHNLFGSKANRCLDGCNSAQRIVAKVLCFSLSSD